MNTPHTRTKSISLFPQLFAFVVWVPMAVVLIWAVEPAYSLFEPAYLDELLVKYCIGLLAFTAGTRAGVKLSNSGNLNVFERFAAASALFALVALFLPAHSALAVLIVGFGAQGALDVWAGFRGRLPQSYVDMRRWMTWLVCLTLVCIFVLRGMA